MNQPEIHFVVGRAAKGGSNYLWPGQNFDPLFCSIEYFFLAQIQAPLIHFPTAMAALRLIDILQRFLCNHLECDQETGCGQILFQQLKVHLPLY